MPRRAAGRGLVAGDGVGLGAENRVEPAARRGVVPRLEGRVFFSGRLTDRAAVERPAAARLRDTDFFAARARGVFFRAAVRFRLAPARFAARAVFFLARAVFVLRPAGPFRLAIGHLPALDSAT
jgi:hypothetical protein